MICKGCKKEIDDPKPLIVYRGIEQIPDYFHGMECWNQYMSYIGKPEDYPMLRKGK